MKTDLFQSCVHCWVFQICWHIECSTFTASSFRFWNSSTGIPSPLLALFIVMLPKAHFTLHSRMSGSSWVITPSWLSGSLRSFFYSSSGYPCHLFLSDLLGLKAWKIQGWDWNAGAHISLQKNKLCLEDDGQWRGRRGGRTERGRHLAVNMGTAGWGVRLPSASSSLCLLLLLSLQSCPTLCDPIVSSPPGSPSLGFSRQEHWSGLPFPSPMHGSDKWSA